MATFTKQQVQVLLRPINPSRVLSRTQAGRKFSYISQHDARAHAIRVFGFGGFDSRTIHAEVLYSDKTKTRSGSDAWDVGVLATVEVTIRNPSGDTVCVYSETAVGSSTQPQRGEALDMAVKTATSDAFKRCLINLGDQFALGLYQDGETSAWVKGTIILGSDDGSDAPHHDEDEHAAGRAPADGGVE